MKTKIIMNHNIHNYKLFYNIDGIKVKYYNDIEKLNIDFFMLYCYSKNMGKPEPYIIDKYGNKLIFNEFIETYYK